MPERIPQSTTIRVPLKAYLASDHISPATGKTLAVTISKNGAAYGNPSGGATNATEIASGSYYVDLSTTDAGTLGPLFILGTASGVDPVEVVYDVVKATNAGFTALPDTACTTNASLVTSGTGTDQISVASGRVDLGKILGTASAGTAGYVGIDWAHVNAPTTAVGLTGTTIATTQQVDVNTIKTQAVTAAGGITFPAATLASTTNITAGTITTVTTLTNAPTAGDLTATMKASITTAATAATPTVTAGTVSDKAGYSLDLTQSVPTSNTTETVGDALNVARALGAGKWTLVGTTLKFFAHDGTTVVAQFALDSAATPTTRTPS